VPYRGSWERLAKGIVAGVTRYLDNHKKELGF